MGVNWTNDQWDELALQASRILEGDCLITFSKLFTAMQESLPADKRRKGLHSIKQAPKLLERLRGLLDPVLLAECKILKGEAVQEAVQELCPEDLVSDGSVDLSEPTPEDTLIVKDIYGKKKVLSISRIREKIARILRKKEPELAV